MEEKEREDAEHLRDLRQTAGLNIAQLAAMANLSAGQIRQLEEGGDNLFYSPKIKAQSMRRVIRMLENPLPTGSPIKVLAEEPAPRGGANVIDDIIRLSEKNLSGNVVTSLVWRPARKGGILSLVAIACIGFLVFAGWQSNQEIPVSKFSEWVNPSGMSESADKPSTANVLEPVGSNAVKTEEVKAESVAHSPLASSVATAPAPIKVLPAKETKSEMQVDINNQRDCASITTEATTISPHSVSKPGNYVFIQAAKPVQLCVDDAKRNRTVLNLEPGAGRSVHGTPPWTISSSGLSSVTIYFQGSKLILPGNSGQRIYLAEQVVSP
jgi:hypothetical protein